MTVTREEIIAAARACIGTPFHHQGRRPGVGLDCVGLVVAAATACGIQHEDCTDYSRRPDGVTLVREISKSMKEIDVPAAGLGDVLVFWIRRPDRPQHLGICTDYGMIHTYQEVDAVSEHRLTEAWRKRIHSAWRFRGAS